MNHKPLKPNKMKSVDKKVEMTLVGLDGNAFALMGAFQREARRQGWEQDEIDIVLDECRSGDYNHLLATLMDYTEELNENDEDEYSYELYHER